MVSGQSAAIVSHTACRVKLRDLQHSLQEEDIRGIAASTHGFVGADMVALCQEATMCALRRVVRQRTCQAAPALPAEQQASHTPEPLEVCSIMAGPSPLSSSCYVLRRCQGASCLLLSLKWSLPEACPLRLSWAPVSDTTQPARRKVGAEDFAAARARVRPSGLREVALELPRVRWADVGGHAAIKQRLQEAVQWPQQHPELLKRLGAKVCALSASEDYGGLTEVGVVCPAMHVLPPPATRNRKALWQSHTCEAG